MLKRFNRLLAIAAALLAGFGLYAERPATDPTAAPAASAAPATVAPTTLNNHDAIVERAIRRRTLAAARQAAADATKPAREAHLAAQAAAKAKGVEAAAIKPQPGVVAPPGVMNPLGTPDYISGLVPNYANSPRIRKFVDTLPGLGAAQANNLGNYIPVGVPDRTTFPASGSFPASDYYNIDLVDYTQKLHSDLPPTHLRGYQTHTTNITNGAPASNYLGPVIVAQKDRPVRLKFNNRLGVGAAGNLLLPVDTSLMGAGAAPTGTFSQNRALLHLHGGLNPWIGDGTPHQWFTPAGEPNANKKGASFQNVPDMGSVIPGGYPGTAGDGVGTYFYSNQQSGRFMFYHDHAFGLTRLNVYAGEAAGYMIVDPVETSLINQGVIPSPGSVLPISTDPWDPTPYNASTHPVHQPLAGNVYTYGIPLVVQDKTFVPGPADLAAQDPTWDTAHWGGYGDLWFPHVYMPNQNPYNAAGANAMGRWDYGPWFWPIVPTWTDPNTPPPAGYLPYGHGVIPGANPGDPGIPGCPNPSLTPESFLDTPVINGTPYPTVTLAPTAYRFRILNAANDRMFNFAFYYADPAHPTEVVMIPATQAEAALAATAFATKYTDYQPVWPTDGRPEGVVDWRTAGPDIIQIGTESGFLPDPVIWHPQPTNYNYNRRDIVVLNIAEHGLFLGPAERADIIVDFSSVPSGSTLILYNDMLAPVPAFDIRYDYYTGDPDRSLTGDGSGGAPSTPIGFGPNTRTLMQVKIVGAPTAPFNVAALQAAFKADPAKGSAFFNAQHLPIVPESTLNSAMGGTWTDTFSNIGDYSLTYNKTENGTANTMPMQSKAIQELFELNWGRMNATLGIELPSTNFTNQTTIPIGYSEPATELLTDGTTQVWKITHNGVDTHPVHFHLFDVQVVNRVGWDGAVRMPDPNEIGWKDTVRMNPLEDIIVAFRPLSPRLPFVAPLSVRVMDPTQPATATINVTDVSAAAGNLGNLGAQIAVSNSNAAVLGQAGPGYSYGWEYVWHCHILGHEENDFMRPVVLTVATTVPLRPGAPVAVNQGLTRVDVYWSETHNANDNETGFRVERRNNTTPTNPVWTVMGTTVPEQNFFVDFSVVAGNSYSYRVYAYNQKGDSPVSVTSNAVTPAAVAPATGVTLVASPATSAPIGTAVTFTATATGTGPFTYQFLVNGAVVTNTTANTYVLPTTAAAGVYSVTVNVTTAAASAVVTATIPYTITAAKATGVQILPNLPSPQPAIANVVFTATGIGSSGYLYQFSVDGVVVQAYSATNTYALPAATTTAGLHQVAVAVITNIASVTPDATATIPYTITTPANATGVTMTSSLPSPQVAGTAVTFTATGQGSTGYVYAFYLSSNGGANFTLVQPFGPSNTYVLPGTTAVGNYIVAVDAKSSVAGTVVSLWQTFSIVAPAATGVTLTASLPNPQPVGTAVLFTAAGQGASGYQYAFYLSSNGGASFAQVQAFSATATWTLPNTTVLGDYIVAVDCRTSVGGAVVSQWRTFSIVAPPPTGVTLTTSLASPQVHGTAVLFTAAGQGASGYQYAFYLSADGGATFALVQAFSATATWTLPITTAAGNYIVAVDCKTSANGAVISQWRTFTLN